MTRRYSVRRDFEDIGPFLRAIQTQADSERNALGFLPEPAYAEAARQRKLVLIVSADGESIEYAGHLLFGGVFPTLRVRQVCVSPNHRRNDVASTLIRTLKSQGEMEGYFSIVANVAADLQPANQFYEKNGFSTLRCKPGGATRGRTINVRTLQLDTPNLITLMADSHRPSGIEAILPKKRSQITPLYAIDLNVFFDAIRPRARSKDASALFGAALRQQIRIAASDEFVRELERNSKNRNDDPALALARQIPSLPPQDKAKIQGLIHQVAPAVFPERSIAGKLSSTDESDVRHLCHAIAAGAAGYVTSDSKVLAARDLLFSQFELDIIGLAEFADLLNLPETSSPVSKKATKYFRIETPNVMEADAFLKNENLASINAFGIAATSQCERTCVSDDGGIIGISLLLPARGLDQASKSVICVQQDHAFSSTVADYLISEQIRTCSRNSACNIAMLDMANFPITRRMALIHGYTQSKANVSTLNKIAIGQPVTRGSWPKTRLAVERLVGLKLQNSCPRYDKPIVKIELSKNQKSEVSLFDLETLLSPTLFSFPKRDVVVVPITAEFANALLGTERQYSFLEVPEAQFLSRRTYFNTIRASRVMIRGAAIAFYESARSKGRGAIVALGRIVDVTSIPVENIPEFMKRGAVVDDVSKLTRSKRVLVTTFDNVIALKSPVSLKKLRQIGCVNKSNFVSATAISASHLEKIVLAGFSDE